MLAFAVFLLVANIVFFVCFYTFAKNRFSRESLLKDVEKELDLLYKDLRREIDNSISVIEDRTAALKSLIEVADKRILLAASEIEKREKAASFAAPPLAEAQPDAQGEDASPSAVVYTKRQIIARAAEAESKRLGAATGHIGSRDVKPETPERERVVMLARQDISPDEISKILSIPQSEVELILALDL